MTHATWVLAGLAVLLLVGKGLQVLQRRTGIPDALVLLALGALAAQSGVLDVRGLGKLVPVFTTSALVLLLFEGAIDVRVEELRRSARATLLLTCVSFVLSTLAVAVVGFLLLGMDVLQALLLGSILGGTSSSVVVPLVRGLRLGKDLQLVLTLESALNDVLCVVGALVLLALCQGQALDGWTLTLGLGRDIGAALVLGVVCGGALALALGTLRGRGSSFMVLLAALFLVYALAEGLTGQGVLACLAFGMVLGSAPMLLAWAPGGAR
ncbi:cation:proton antiporter domain-containing protein, partial [Pyxidicoccus fallax]